MRPLFLRIAMRLTGIKRAAARGRNVSNEAAASRRRETEAAWKSW
jgi:hypothetical protein